MFTIQYLFIHVPHCCFSSSVCYIFITTSICDGFAWSEKEIKSSDIEISRMPSEIWVIEQEYLFPRLSPSLSEYLFLKRLFSIPYHFLLAINYHFVRLQFDFLRSKSVASSHFLVKMWIHYGHCSPLLVWNYYRLSI